jgi:tetrahydromethanopterin S-methyltransferase subunit G
MHNTAFTVAEKAVQAALAAADRAVSKAELAADKRFEALNELRQMLNDMVSTLITRVEALQRFDGITDKIDAATRRYEGLEARFNTMSGEITGGERRGSGVKTNVGMIVGIVGGGVGLMLLLIALARYLGGR